MLYRDLIHFEPIESVVQLTSAKEKEYAFQQLSTYVISDRMAEQINELIIEQLQLNRFVDNKGLFIVGNYGTGKSHLMSVISTIAEFAGTSQLLANSQVAEKAKEIEGKFKVIRTEIGSVKTPLREIICGAIEDYMEEIGVDFQFPSMEKIRNNKDSFLELMAIFKENYPEHGLLLVVDELLDYLNSRKQQELFLDLGFLREIGEICSRTEFRFIAGIQEMLFDNPRFQFVAEQIRRVKERFEQVSIIREDIAYVVSQRLLKKDEKQKALIREHLESFTTLYSDLNEKMEEYVELFPIHPSYLSTFEKVSVAEKRVALKMISKEIKKRLNRELPSNETGLVSYDSYWLHFEEDSSYRTNPMIREVIDKVKILRDRIQHSSIRPVYRRLAGRIIHALAIFRLTTDDTRAKIGLTAEQLRDDLFLSSPMMEVDDPAHFLRDMITATLKEVMKAVSFQYISYNQENGQYYIDLDKDVPVDDLIKEKAETLSPDQLDRYFFELVANVMEHSHDPYTSGYRIWLHELPWHDRKVNRQGYLFFGAPNERSTAQPERDFYLYILQPFDPPKYVDEQKKDEVFFKFINKDKQFEDWLKAYAAAQELSLAASAEKKRLYENKATQFLKQCTKWFVINMPTTFQMTYQGITKKLGEWSYFAHHKESVREIINEAAADCLKEHFADKYVDYPTFRKLETPISKESLPGYAIEAIKNIKEPKTKSAKAILDGLVLLDKQDKLQPRQSGYAKWILELLDEKGPGQVVNHSEILETHYIHGSEDIIRTKEFNLEPEWLAVLLVALVETGEIVLTIDGTDYDAMKLDSLIKLPLKQILQFSHLKRPSGLPIREWEAIFALLEVDRALLRTSLRSGITKVIIKAEQLVKEILQMNRHLQAGFLTWEGPLLTAQEIRSDQERLRELKQFLEGLQRYDSEAKAKNLKYSLDEIAKHQAALDRLKELQSLQKRLQEWKPLADYLVNAQHILPTNHLWQAKAKLVLTDLLQVLRQGGSGLTEKRRAEKVKEAYQDLYLKMHNQSRLNATEENRKSQLLQDRRYTALSQLQMIDVLPQQELQEWKRKLNAFTTCYHLTKERLASQPVCMYCNYRPNEERRFEKSSLEELDEQLDQMLESWTGSLLNNLQTPEIRKNIEMIGRRKQALVEAFLKKEELTLPIDPKFIEAMKELFSGIDRVEITVEQVLEMMGNGRPLTVTELRQRFEQLLTASISAKRSSQVRIMLSRGVEEE